MELCTATPAISSVPDYRRVSPSNFTQFGSTTFRPLKQTSISLVSRSLKSRLLYFTNSLPRATTSEETSSGTNEYVGEERGPVITVESNENVPEEEPKVEIIESPVDGATQTFELLDNISLDSENTFSVLLLGGGALVALWLASAVIGAIDSIPLFPKLMEIVGLSYTVWFTTRYLIFKENRDELAAKIEELKQEVLGSQNE